MKRGVEFAGFGLLALGLHVGALTALQSPPDGGSAASGAGGDALVSLEASSVAVADLVTDWDQPPEALTEVLPELPQMAEPQRSQPTPPLAPAPPPAPSAMPSPSLQPPAHDNPALPEPPQAPPPEPVPEPEVADVAPTYAPKMTSRPVERPVRRSQQQQQAPAAVRAQQPPAQASPRHTSPAEASPAQASPAQRAAGQGGGANAGAARAGQAATQTAAALQSAMAEWGGVIRSRIERRKSYPRAAGRAGGTVRVAIRVGADGGLQGLGIAQSSGNAALDQAALSAVQRAGRFPAAPAAIGGGVHSFTLPMTFSR